MRIRLRVCFWAAKKETHRRPRHDLVCFRSIRWTIHRNAHRGRTRAGRETCAAVRSMMFVRGPLIFEPRVRSNPARPRYPILENGAVPVPMQFAKRIPDCGPSAARVGLLWLEQLLRSPNGHPCSRIWIVPSGTLRVLDTAVQRHSIHVRHRPTERSSGSQSAPSGFLDLAFVFGIFDAGMRRHSSLVPSGVVKNVADFHQRVSRDFGHVHTCSISFRTSSAASNLDFLLVASFNNCKTTCKSGLSCATWRSAARAKSS